MKWTNNKIAQLKRLWKKGSIAEEIAEVLGTSKGAVIGKANGSIDMEISFQIKVFCISFSVNC